MSLHLRAIVAAACLGVPSLLAAATAPHLGAPLVTKLDWEISSLTIADIDGDKRNDIALLNNDTGRVELLYQRKPDAPIEQKRSVRRDRWTPNLDDALFRRDSIAGDAAMLALAVGDLNGDGLPDIVFTSERNGLNVIFQGPQKGEWRTPLKNKRFDSSPRSDSLQITTVAGGARAIVQLAKSGIALWTFQGNGTIPDALPEPVLLRTDGVEGKLFVQKLTGDGATAFGTLIPGEETTLRFRLRSDAGFGPEVTLRIPVSSLNLSTPLQAGKGAISPKFAAVAARQRTVSEVSFSDDARPLDGAESAALQTYAPPNGIGGPAHTVLLDVDGDGVTDLIVADPKGAKLLVYSGLPDGDFKEPVEYPSLSGISALASISEKGRPPALLVLSEKESILGAVTFDKGKPGFPVPIAVSGKPLHLASQGALAIALVRDDSGKNAFHRILRDEGGAWKLEADAAVETSRREIVALQLADINNDGLPDILAYVDRESMRLWTQGKDGKFQETAKDSAYRKSILDSVTPADIGWGIVDDSGKPALLVSAQGYVRALRVDDKGELAVVFQANSRRPGDRLRAPLAGKFGADGKIVLLACNETDKSLEWLERDSEGVFRTRQFILLDAFVPLSAWTQEVAGEKTPRLLYLTKERIVQVPTARRGLCAGVKKLYETDLAGFTPVAAVVGNLGTTRSLTLLDPVKHVLELIQSDAAGKWSSALHFTLFDDNPHYRGRRSSEIQPREARVADLTGDGLNDLVLLMHDRVFVYPQQVKKK
ncbi:MAG: VCBS repeat-containing protein [Puniceicoccales bacterium]|jgi:hypothetical protein|nr:VCBS repeat-containing protein [Puniceicoccales bacterium]